MHILPRNVSLCASATTTPSLLFAALLALSGCEPGCQSDTLGEQVTGNPRQGFTADFEQAETAIAVARVAQQPPEDVVTISYNDRTELDPNDPFISYPTPSERTVRRGASLMGWSNSTNDGALFTYGGKVSPPEGWAVIWGDPALVEANDEVYLANLAGSDLKWPGDLVNQSMAGRLDGFCVAHSPFDGGVTFPFVRCFKMGSCEDDGSACTSDTECNGGCNGDFYDGTALESFNGYVWFAAQNVTKSRMEVWRAEAGTLDFEPFDDLAPFDGTATVMHPRFRTHNNRLYIVAQRAGSGHHMATFLEGNDTTWKPPLIISYPSPIGLTVTLSDRNVREANQFSYALAFNEDADRDELRILQTRQDPETGKLFVYVVSCDADLLPSAEPGVAICANTGWSTADVEGDQFAPLLFRAGGELGPDFAPTVWKAVWLSREEDPSGNVLEVRQANLATIGAPPVQVLFDSGLVVPQVPCSTDDSPGYWGDYNDLTQLIKPQDMLVSTRFITAFSRNGTAGECDFRTEWTADMHVGAIVFQ
jgi:hypothetical protein